MTETTVRTAAIYARVSTGGQDVANQRPDLMAAAKARGFELDQVEVYEEVQGAGKDRPVLRRCLTACQEGRHSHLIVWSIDRLGRSMSGNLDMIVRLDGWGVEIVSCREPWLVLNSPVRSLLCAIFSWISEQEKRRISERTKASLARIKAAGEKRLGRPPVHVDVAAALNLMANGLSQRAAAAKLRCSPTTLARALKAHQAALAAPQTVTLPVPAPKVAEPIEITKAA